MHTIFMAIFQVNTNYPVATLIFFISVCYEPSCNGPKLFISFLTNPTKSFLDIPCLTSERVVSQ